MSQNEIMMTVFPMFQQHIEPHLVHAHLKIWNDFDPVLSPESSLFLLKSNKQVIALQWLCCIGSKPRDSSLLWIRSVVSILASFQRSNMILETLVHWILSLTASFHCLGDTLSQIYTMHSLQIPFLPKFSKEMKLKQITLLRCT
ncbi:hypothetical protein NL676_013948 [Syzygium grande]|nr:hypothetical protein NL676_013948 [Syzygium grande]